MPKQIETQEKKRSKRRLEILNNLFGTHYGIFSREDGDTSEQNLERIFSSLCKAFYSL